MIASARGVPMRMVPYAAAAALTRVAKQAATEAVPAQMQRVFDRPTAYTLNALRFTPATATQLFATVAVKDKAAGIAPNRFLSPQEKGGARGQQRRERAFAYAGVLASGRYAMPGAATALDAHGNVKASDVRTILTALKNIKAASATTGRDGSKRKKGRKLDNSLFVGKPRGGSRPEGIYRREGQRLRPLFIFTNQTPSYAPRMDFSGTVARVARDRFAVEFKKALEQQLASKTWRAK